jgi:hypothetical protein
MSAAAMSLIEQLRAVVLQCEQRRQALDARPLDPLAEAVHFADTVGHLAAAMDNASPGLGVRLITALYVQVRAQDVPPGGDYIAETPAAAAVH